MQYFISFQADQRGARFVGSVAKGYSKRVLQRGCFYNEKLERTILLHLHVCTDKHIPYTFTTDYKILNEKFGPIFPIWPLHITSSAVPITLYGKFKESNLLSSSTIVTLVTEGSPSAKSPVGFFRIM